MALRPRRRPTAVGANGGAPARKSALECSHEDVVLVFGRETGGLPPAIQDAYEDGMVAMPIVSPHVRSLNLSTSVGIALYEVLRQRRR
jgi:tRNA(Leu) C34 or U34 (ribose-2'-O)-methylase TrmL